MNADDWNVVGAIIAIALFIVAGPRFAYGGYRKWKLTEVESGKFEFFFGIGLFVLAIILVFVLLPLVKNNIIVEPTISPEPPISDTGGARGKVYVSDQPYRGATYSGYINELRHPDGEGTMKYSNGTEYTGDWVDGVRQGWGRMRYDNGVYDGEWQNGQKNGKGTYIWNDGAYEDDARSGEGIFSGWVDLTNGYSGTYCGKSENDQFDGYGKFLFDNGDIFEGIYKKNFFWTGTYTQKDGSQHEIINGEFQL